MQTRKKIGLLIFFCVIAGTAIGAIVFLHNPQSGNVPAQGDSAVPPDQTTVDAPTPGGATVTAANTSKPPSQPGESPTDAPISPADVLAMPKAKAALQFLGINPETDLKESGIQTVPPYGTEVVFCDTRDFKELRFTRDGTLSFYCNPKISSDAEHEQRISLQDALERANSFLKGLGIVEFFVEQDVHSSYCTESEWELNKLYTYEGYPMIGSRLSVTVSAYDGTVTSLSNHPPEGYPDVVEERISRNDALVLAQRLFAEKTEGQLDWLPQPEPRLQIVSPNNMWSRSKEDALKRTGKPRLCWRVLFRPEGEPVDGVSVWIDAATGEVIGGLSSF